MDPLGDLSATGKPSIASGTVHLVTCMKSSMQPARRYDMDFCLPADLDGGPLRAALPALPRAVPAGE